MELNTKMTTNLNVHAGPAASVSHSAARPVPTVAKTSASSGRKVAGLAVHKGKSGTKADGSASHSHPNVKSLHISTHDKTGLYQSETEHAKFVPHVPDKLAAAKSPKVSDEGKTGLKKAGSHLHKISGPTVMTDVKKNAQKEKNATKAAKFAAHAAGSSIKK
jgi:hypothetical protein